MDKEPVINPAEPDTFRTREINGPEEIKVAPEDADWGVDLDEIEADQSDEAK